MNQNDEICSIITKNMTQAVFPVSVNIGNDPTGETRPSQKCNLILSFDGNNCTISGDDEEISSAGSGEFIPKGSGKPEYKDYQWQGEGKPNERDILRLSYTVNFKKGRVIGTKTVNGKDQPWILENDVQVTTTDTLVVQTRESNKREFYSPKYVKE